MSSRTVKWLLLASVLLIAFPVVAAASTARVQGMAIQSDYIKDYTNVYTYLSEVSCVGNVVFGEFGNVEGDTYTRDRGVGVILNNLWDGKYGAIALRLSEETAQIGQGDANTAPGAGYDSWDPNHNTEHAFDIVWGKKFGSMSLGLQMNRSYGRIEGDPSIYYGYYGGWNDIKGDWWESYSPSELNWHRNVLGFGAGLGYEFSPKLTVEGSILYQSRTFMAKDTLYDHGEFSGNYGYYAEESLTPGQKYENDGSAAYLVAARALWQAQPNLLLVPVFKFYSFNVGYKGEFYLPDSLTSTRAVKLDFTPMDDKISGWQLGIAGNWTLNQNDLLVLGATIASNKEEVKYRDVEVTYDYYGGGGEGDPNVTYSAPYVADEYKYTETMMPTIFASLETHLNSWLTLRFGAQQGVFYSYKNETKHFELNADGDVVPDPDYPTQTTTEKYSPFTMMLGAGFKFGNLQLDATVNPDFFHNGPYFISGQTTGYDAYDFDGNALFPKVTATYTF